MKNYCPFCGHDVSEEPETEYGIFCSQCGNDFWRSETIPESEISAYQFLKLYNMMVKTGRMAGKGKQ